MIRPTAAATNW